MANITIKQLRYFAAVARYRHFGRAAEMCNVTQPGLSLQLKDLEEGLGGRLIERGGAQVSLSELGRKLLPRVQEILDLLEELDGTAAAEGKRLAGRLRMGLIPTVAPYMLPYVLQELARATLT